MGSGKPTSLDIAFRAGVSQSTVSRALRDSPLVNENTRERIKKIALELNYKADHSAAVLRSQRSRTIALLLFEDPTSDDSRINPFFLAMLSSITRVADLSGHDVLISFQRLDDDWHTEYQVRNRADGIILLGYGDYLAYRARLDRLIESGAHFVLWGPPVGGNGGYSVSSDNVLGGHEATAHLLGLGRERIAFLGEASLRAPEFEQRYRGYVQAHYEAGLSADDSLRVDAESSEASGVNAVNQLMERNCTFDAIVAASDLIAIGAIRALQERGFKVPEDVGVVGYDDIHAAAYFNPGLTTIRQDTQAAGKRLVEHLLGMIHGEPSTPELLRPALVIRSSCGSR